MDKQRFDIIIGMQTGEITKGVKAANGNLKQLKAALKDALSALPGGKNITKELQAARDQVQGLIKEVTKLQNMGAAKGKTNLGQFTPRQQAVFNAGVEQAKKSITNAVPSNIVAQQAKALQQLQSKAITLRYAMYDVGSAANNASQALLGYAGAVLEATSVQQQAFAQIEKTQIGNKNATAELKKLKDELITLSTTIPVSFTELSKIGMLGAQMGVAAKDIARFTEVTAKFSALTGISAEDAAQSIGKVAGLLGIGADQYAALGSAIVGVGFASKATEAQIISTAGQIGAIAKQAGLANTEVIGLSSAMASLKIAPEEARGVIQPTFAAIGAATRSFNEDLGTGSELLSTFTQLAKSGATEIVRLGDKSGYSSQKMAMFSKLSKGTAANFVELWGDKTKGGAGAVFQSFITGLGNTDVGAALVKIGLDGVRTSKGLTALGMNAETVGKQMQIALTEGTKGTLLDDASAGIIDNIASKLTMLQNSIEAVMAAAGSNPMVIGILGNMLDIITKVNKAFADVLAGGGLPGALAGLTVLIAGIGGLFFSLVATLALVGGGFLALKTAMQAAAAEGIVFNAGLKGLLSSLIALLPASKATAASFNTVEAGAIGARAGVLGLAMSMRTLKYAMISTGIGIIAVVLFEVIANLVEAADKAGDTETALNSLGSNALAAAEKLQPLKEEMQNLLDTILEYPKSVTAFETSMYNLGQAVQTNGKYFGDTTKAGRDNLTAFRNVLQAMFDASNGSADVYASSLVRFRNHLASIGLLSTQMRDEINNILTGMSWSLTTKGVLDGSKSLNNGLNDIKGGAERAKTALEKLDEVLQKVFRGYDVKIGIMDAFDKLGKSIAENGKVFGYGTSGMRSNLKALEDTISAFKESSNGDLAIFRGNLLSLRTAMQRLGVTSGPALAIINAALAKTGSKGKASAKEIAAIFNAISGSIKKNAQTISDYVNDLNTALTDAFSNRYGAEEAMDKITLAFNDMKVAADDARAAISDAQREIAGIRADKNILEYQLSVAVRYGDTLRAEAIRSKLAKANADLADQESKINENQKVLNKSLTDGSAASIENKAKLRELVQSANAYLLTQAQGGKSSTELKAKAKELADQFMAQGKALGFAESELRGYLDDFVTDFTTVVNGVPRDISIVVSTDPALEAIKQFVTDANNALSGINSSDIGVSTYSSGSKSSGTSGSGIPKVTNTIPPQPTTNPGDGWMWSYNSSKKSWDRVRVQSNAAKPTASAIAEYTAAKKAAAIQLKNRTASNPTSQDWSNANTAYNAAMAVVKVFETKYGNKYASGGFVSGPGTSTSDSIPARLSSGEYVVQANAVRYYGTDFMNALNNIQVQRQSFSGSGAGSNGMVYLSPEDRQLLRAAIERPINLYADSKQLASTVSTGNVSLARRGLN